MFHPLCFDGDRDGNETDATCIAGSVNQVWSDFVSSGFDPVRSFPQELFVEMIQLLKRPVGGLEDRCCEQNTR